MATLTDPTYSFLKDPGAVLDFAFDWTLWLSPSEAITASTMTASPGLTINSSSHTTLIATVWLSGGNAGTPYTVTNEIVTNQGRTEDRTIVIRCQDR